MAFLRACGFGKTGLEVGEDEIWTGLTGWWREVSWLPSPVLLQSLGEQLNLCVRAYYRSSLYHAPDPRTETHAAESFANYRPSTYMCARCT